MGAVGILAALAHRDRTGEGQFIELSQAENAIRMLDWTWLYQHYSGKGRERCGNRDVSISPSDIFPCKDDLVAIAAASDVQFRGLCKAMGQPRLAEDSKFKTHENRLQEDNMAVLLNIIRAWAADKSYAEIDKLAGKHGFAAQKVCNGKDLFEDEHLAKRNFRYTVDDPVYGEIVEEGIVPKFSETPARIKWAGRPIGFDNEYVLTNFLGISEDRIVELYERKIIGRGSDKLPSRTPPKSWDGKSGILLAK
jgi:crotonobetainyl-CoA:carnitine CoA-transferase CaiB-like acyl-CoA transferase